MIRIRVFPIRQGKPDLYQGKPDPHQGMPSVASGYARFVSGYAFRHTAGTWIRIAPSGAGFVSSELRHGLEGGARILRSFLRRPHRYTLDWSVGLSRLLLLLLLLEL